MRTNLRMSAVTRAIMTQQRILAQSNLSPEIPEHVIQEAIQLRMEFIPSPPQDPPPPQKKQATTHNKPPTTALIIIIIRTSEQQNHHLHRS